ncbi:MAG: acyltransferase [Lachnospiraceae bacterium]|nr:acyltransferase [Lachnospiraceae bacterium]
MNKRLWYSLRISMMMSSDKRVNYLRKKKVFGHIGKNSIWRDRLIPLYAEKIFLGNNVRCGSKVLFITHDVIHDMLNNREGNVFQFKEKKGEIHIGDNVFIGSNSTILYDVNIGSNVIVAAGSLVNKDIPSNSVFGGVPARYICSFDELVEKRKRI